MTISSAEYGVESMVAPLRCVLLKHARDAYRNHDAVAAGWRRLGYSAPPDWDLALRQYEAFLDLLRVEVPLMEFLEPDAATSLDSIYAYDSVVMAGGGAVVCRMGKELRRPESSATSACLQRLGIPILGRIEPPGTLEAGDVVWLDGRTLAVGRGYRTNDEGIRQLRQILAPAVHEVIVVPLPHWRGPEGCLHLMSLISLVDAYLAVTYSPLLPVFMRQRLLEIGYTLLDVPDEEYRTLGSNVLALAPRRCLLAAGNAVTRRLLEDAGATVLEYEGSEISQKGRGGPTCLTRPLLRR